MSAHIVSWAQKGPLLAHHLLTCDSIRQSVWSFPGICCIISISSGNKFRIVQDGMLQQMNMLTLIHFKTKTRTRTVKT